MQEGRRLGSAQKPGQLELPAGRIEQILAPHHHGDALPPVVHDDRKLIRPVARTIAREQIAALRGRLLRLLAQAQIGEVFDGCIEPDAKTDARFFRQTLRGTGTGIRLARDVGARTLARVDETACAQRVERVFVDRAAFALAHHEAIVRKSQPREVFENGGVELRAAALPIVIFDPQQHAAACA